MSKLGVHVASDRRQGIDAILRAGCPGVLMCDQNLIADAKKAGCLTAFRTKHASQKIADGSGDNPQGLLDMSIDTIPQLAKDWITAQMIVWKMNPFADFYVNNNELDAGTLDHARKLNVFHLEAMKYAEMFGYRLGIFSFSSGCPSDNAGITAEQRWTEMLPAVRYAAAHGHALVLHAHALDNGPLGETGENIAYRFERDLRFFEANRVSPLPMIIIGELSNGVGGVEPNLSDYMQQIKAWDTHVMSSRFRDQLLFGALYGYNTDETIKTAAADVAEWIAANPTPIAPPPIDFAEWDKHVILVPQGITAEQYAKVCAEAIKTKTEVAFSAHTAFDWPEHAITLKVTIVNQQAWGGGRVLLDWAKERFGKLPTTVEYMEVQ